VSGSDSEDSQKATGGTFKVVFISGKELTFKFDRLTSVGWVTSQCLKEHPDSKAEDIRLVWKTEMVLKKPTTKLSDIFGGTAPEDQIITCAVLPNKRSA